MSQFRVGKILEEFSYSNVLNHHKNDFKEQIYLMINNTIVYESIPIDKINPGTIGLNQPIRNKLSLALEDKVTIQIYKPKDKTISKININLTNMTKKKGFISLHEENIKDKIFETFKKHYFYNNQTLLMKLDTTTIVLDISCTDEGFLNQQTQFKIQSSDEGLNIISAILLKRDLFQDTYNFEEIGIGGLNIELINIFRRALSTRAIKSSIAQKLGIKHVKGILLHGPPGTGKTLIARKIGAMISKVEPKVVNGPEVMNKYVGQSEENIRNLFSEAMMDEKSNGENSNLHVIIFDE
ncbi:AAA family ATPase, partial [Klosneuvirus KNV1]